MSPSDKDERESEILIKQARLALLRWYDDHRRDLPWRRTHDPYRIWVSEIMLQQTTVRTVLRYYERFLEQFSTVESLARAELSEVLKCWEGLGYYQRAKNLHRAARIVASEMSGRWPQSVEEWQSLPGIGRSTAGAIHSLSMNLWAPILDANVRRVTLRFFGISSEETALNRRLWEASDSWGNQNPRPADTNQALMELGAIGCLPVAPACGSCPVASFCKSRNSFSVPNPLKETARGSLQKTPSPLRRRVALVPSSGPLLFEPREEGRLLEGLLEISGFASPGLEPGDVLLHGSFAGWKVLGEVCRVRHVYSHFREEIRVFRVSSPVIVEKGEPDTFRERGVWATAEGAKDLALTGVARKILSALQSRRGDPGQSSAENSLRRSNGRKGRPEKGPSRKVQSPLFLNPLSNGPEEDRG